MSCKVTWCDLESLFKGFCNKHYLQNKRHGKVFITGRDVRKAVTDKNRTGYKGVYYHKAAKKFAARIQFMRKSYHLGLFNSKLDAADAYDKAAYKYFGEFARLNRVN